MSISLDFIKSITVSKLEYPLYDHLSNPSKCFFALEPTTIWNAGDVDDKGRQRAFPAALSRNATHEVKISPAGLAVLPGLTPPYTVTAKLGTMDVFDSQPVTDIVTGVKALNLIQPTINGQPKSLPWVFYGDFNWTFKGSKKDQPQYTCSTAVEIYVLPAHLPPFFQRSGIPLALLRLQWYLATWMRTTEAPTGKPALNWPSFAVNALFTDPRLEYDVWRGACKYISWNSSYSLDTLFACNIGVDCWLDLWLSDLYGVTLAGATHTVNCYDLAGLGQVLASLGVDDSINNIRMKYMTPFGYIQKTRLIGRLQIPPTPSNVANECNNPFYGIPGRDPMMLCADDSLTRSAFGNHMFLTIAGQAGHAVYDACCGPQLGTLLLKDYPARVIDTNPARYPGRNRPGGINDIMDGVGVDTTVTSRCFERTGPPDPNSKALLDRLAIAMANEGTWYQPYLSAPSGNWKITATWTFVPLNNTKEIVNVNVFTYPTLGEVQTAFARRAASVPGWSQNNTLLEGQSDMVNGSIRIWCDSARLYMAMIGTRVGKAQSTYDLKNKLENILSSTLSQNPVSPNYIQSVTILPQMPVQVGQIIKVTVQVSSFCRVWKG